MNTETYNNMDREQVEMGRTFAEMMNLIEDTRKKEDEREKLRAETMKIQVEAQTLKLRHVVAAFVAAIVFVAAVVGLVKAFL